MMFQMQGSEARTTRFGRIVGVEELRVRYVLLWMCHESLEAHR